MKSLSWVNRAILSLTVPPFSLPLLSGLGLEPIVPAC